MRQALIPILVAILGWLFLQSVPCVLAQSTYPSDLTIWAISGGPAPWERLERMEIDSTGYSTYWLTTNRTTGEWVLNASFTLSEDNLTTIWNAIQTNNFFSLAPNYTDPQWIDGSYCIMNITANGQTHYVVTQNIKVPQFDAIAITINSVTPGDLDLFYNAIHPEWDPPTAQSIVETLSEVTGTLSPSSVFLYGTLICSATFVCLKAKKIRKVNHRCLSNSFVFFIMFFVVIMLTVNSVVAETAVTATKCSVTVDIYLEFFGSGVTQALVNEFERGIEEMWNCGGTYKWCGLCTVRFDVHAIISAGGGTQPSYHQINVVRNGARRPRWTATQRQFNPATGKTSAGQSWWSDEIDPNRPRGNRAAHEVGHLMGRRDTYTDVPVNPNDPNTRLRSVPNVGYENDIMARTRTDGLPPIKPAQEHIDGIIRDSGQIPPPFADALPKTITIVIPMEGRNTGAFNIKISNPTDNLISVSMNFQWIVQPADTIVAILTGYVDVNAHSTTSVGFPIFSVGPNAQPGIYPCRISWTVSQTGIKFDTDPYVELVKPVGGIVLPVDKFGLLAPYIGLVSTILVATVATAIYVKRVKHRKEKQ